MTATLVAATLTRLKENKGSGKNATPTYEPDGQPVTVQFNPTSLKISRSNNVDKGGAGTRTAKRQKPSVEDATLTFDLEFDTADTPARDVRSLTLMVRQFTEPTKETASKPPPPVRFTWGTFMFQGIVTQLTEDLDYFSPQGVPLRAKLSITIREQRPEWEGGKLGAAVRTPPVRAASSGTGRSGAAGGPTTPAAPRGDGPGAAPTSDPVSTAVAAAGDSVQDVLARADQDPAAWRSAMAGLTSPLALAAGTQVQLAASTGLVAGLDAGITASGSAGIDVGLGAGAGFTASAGVGDIAAVRGALGVSGSVAATASAGAAATASAAASAGSDGRALAEATAGFVLDEEGGLARATARLEVDAATSASAAARASFTVPAAPVRAAPVTPAATGPVTADRRALSYGRGVPLRARVRPLPGDAAETHRC